MLGLWASELEVKEPGVVGPGVTGAAEGLVATEEIDPLLDTGE